MIWVQIIIFIITNVPSLIRSIREIRDAFGRDKEVGKAMLHEMKVAKKQAPMDGKDKLAALTEIVNKYKAEADAKK